MWIQRSYQNEPKAGVLYLVPTPIGNLEDMTLRAITILKEADLIAAEDTRHTKKLCRHFDIETPLVSYHEHNQQESGKKLLVLLKEKKTVALVSDAGMPVISDPGQKLVHSCVEQQIPVIPLPGANAALPALIASGLDARHFYFHGFLSRDRKNKQKELKELCALDVPLIFYEAPHRIQETIKMMSVSFGDRKASIARELSKTYEEWVRGSLKEVLQWLGENEIRGEFCIVVEGNGSGGKQEEAWWCNLSIDEHVNHYIKIRQLSKNEAIRQAAKERGLPKREVYHIYHEKSKNDRANSCI